MKKLFVIIFTLFPMSALATECVILLHGLARSASSMSKLEMHLESEGYKVANINYPSRKYPIEQLSTIAIEQGLKNCQTLQHDSIQKIHFVTHSLGGILVRQYLQHNQIENLGHTVMLGPPNQGSEVVDKLKRIPGFTWFNGPAGLQLGTDSESVPKSLGAANFTTGIIAGTRSINLFLSTLIPGTDDGKVSVNNTHVENEKAFITLPVSHPLMMRNTEVINHVIHFVKYGSFIEA